MTSIRSVATVLGAAVLTTLVATTVFWPKATLADGDDTSEEVTLDGTKVSRVVVTAELVRDSKAKSGWVIEVEAENRGTEADTADLEMDVTRTVSNPMSRASGTPTAVFKKKESMTVAAGEKVKRRYDVPANVAAQLTANANAEAAREKAANAGKTVAMPRSVAYFGVALKGQWTDDPIPSPNRRLAAGPPSRNRRLAATF